jgi:Holliday junction DNA helicase RuvB
MCAELSQMIGNQAIKNEIAVEIEACRRRETRFSHCLIQGPSGCGKTYLSNCIASALGIPFHDLDSSLVADVFLDIFDELEVYPLQGKTMVFKPGIVLLDEAHRCNMEVQSILLKILLEGVIYTHGLYYDVRKVSFFLASTNPEKLLPALRMRFPLQFSMRRYTIMEMCQLLMNLEIEDGGAIWRVKINPEIAHFVALRSRYTPRIGIFYMNRIYNHTRCLVDTPELVTNAMTLDVAREFFNMRKINNIGLTLVDFDYMRTLDKSAKTGVKTIAAQMEISESEVVNTIEPYLRFLSYVDFSRGGRVLTPFGRQALNEFDSSEYASEQINDLMLS